MSINAQHDYYGEDYRFTYSEEDSLNITSGDEEDFKYYKVPDDLEPIIDMMGIFTSLLTVLGFFTNCIAIGMLSAPIFERMSFCVLMKILCMYNIVVLFLGTVRYHSFYMDNREHIQDADRRKFCTALLWFFLVFRHARTASIILIVYNRINSLSTPDSFLKYVDAIRLPILGNTLFLLVSTVYVSRYISTLDQRTIFFNRTECTFSYMLPYRQDNELSADKLLSNLPVFEHGTILCMLIYMFIKFVKKSRRNYEHDKGTDSTTSLPTPVRSARSADLKRISVKKQRAQSTSARSSVMPPQGVMEIKEILFPVSTCRVEERDSAVTCMAVTIVLVNMLTSGLREGVDSFIVMGIIPIKTDDRMRFKIRSCLDLSYFTFMATMFFIMCLTCTYFRHASFNLLYSINVSERHSESYLGYGSGSNVNMLPMESVVHTEALESTLGERKLTSSPNLEEGDDNNMTAGSVWSLDRTYSQSAIRKTALIETF